MTQATEDQNVPHQHFSTSAGKTPHRNSWSQRELFHFQRHVIYPSLALVCLQACFTRQLLLTRNRTRNHSNESIQQTALYDDALYRLTGRKRRERSVNKSPPQHLYRPIVCRSSNSNLLDRDIGNNVGTLCGKPHTI